MATSCVTKALVLLSILTVHEVHVVSMRVALHQIKDELQDDAQEAELELQLSNISKTPDKDWQGCKAWTRCSSKEGCARKYLWLDTTRQSCRYTDEYKLRRNQITEFFPTEIARLEEKSQIFATNGCITGGWWYKCYRRHQQILRLSNYVRKAKGIVMVEGESHPAYNLITSEATKQAYRNIASNIAEGFGKNKETKHMCVGEGIKMLMSIPDEIQQIKSAAAEKGVELTARELETLEQSKSVRANLKMVCQDVTDEQMQQLRATIEASGPDESSKVTPSSAQDEIDDVVDDSSDLIMMLDEDDRKAMKEHAGEVDLDDTSEVDDHELEAPGQASNSSLVQLANSGSASLRDGPLKMLVKGGWKGLKWIVGYGPAWIFRRLVWTFSFLLMFMVSAVRAFAIWPALVLLCGSARSIKWLFKDVLWNGDNIKQGFNRIGHCAPEAWDFVGFDTKDPANSAASQILVKPVQDASWVSGVYHPWRNGQPDACRQVKCPQLSSCRSWKNFGAEPVAKCYCNMGYYLNKAGQCDLMDSTNGCKCKPYWSDWGTSYYGCNYAGECKVQSKCQVDLGKAHGEGFVQRMARSALGSKRTTDSCVYTKVPRTGYEVAPASIDRSIDVWTGLKKDEGFKKKDDRDPLNDWSQPSQGAA